MASVADCFVGRVVQREYAQEFDFEHIPIYTVIKDENGVEVSRYISGYIRNFVTAKVVEQTFRFTGLTRAQAFGTAAITVTDLGGAQYTITPKSSITDGSQGSRVMIIEEVNVQRTPVSPHMWEMVVTRRGFRYYVNGSQFMPGPDWIAAYV